MKIRKFLAFTVALAMVFSVVPVFSLTASAAPMYSVTDFIDMSDYSFTSDNLGGSWTAWPWANVPESSVWYGWGGACQLYSISDSQTIIDLHSGDGTIYANESVHTGTQGKDYFVLTWIAEGDSSAAEDIKILTGDGTSAIDTFRFRASHAEGINYSWASLPTAWNSQYVGECSVYSYEDGNGGVNGSDIDMTQYYVVYANKANGDGYTCSYYFKKPEESEPVWIGTKSYDDDSINGFYGFTTMRVMGEWSRMYNVEIYAGYYPGNRVSVEASYTVNGEIVHTTTGSYDTDKAKSVTFNSYSYSANGENTLYTADEVSLSESGTIEMTPVVNNGEYKSGDRIAYNGTQYTVKSGNLIPNGDFSHSITGWYNGSGTAAKAANFSVSDNVLTILNGGGTNTNPEAALYRAWDVEVGKTYFLTFTLDEAIQWARVTEDDTTAYSETNIIMDANTSVAGKNNLVFTASKEYVRTSFAWAQNRQLSNFGLYEIENAEDVVFENIKTISAFAPVKALENDNIVLPPSVTVEGTLGSIVTGSVEWVEPDEYTLDVKTVVNGTVSVIFAPEAEAVTAPVSIEVTVFPYDHHVETFWHAGNDSNSANFGYYNYLGNYNGGVIIADTKFTITNDTTNQLIMYGNSSTSSFSGAGALVRMFVTHSGSDYVFEYYNNGWITSDVVCKYDVDYTLRTEINITDKTYTMAIASGKGDFVNITSGACAYRNDALTSIDRMIYSGNLSMTSHKTAWIEGYSYINVEYVNEDAVSIRDGYRVKTASNSEYYDSSAPKLIENGDKLYILDDITITPSKVVSENEETLTVSYHETEMVEFESPYVNHVVGDATINLPSQVKMIFSDSQKILYNVTWDTSSVDTEALGEYKVTGTIDGVDIKAEATVNVRSVELLDKTTQNTVVTNNGGWNWYVEPSGTHIQPGDELATRYESGQYSSNNGYKFQHDKTYMGWVEDEGTIVVGEYDHDNDTYKRVVVHEFLEADDHNNPAVVVLPDGRIMIFYSKHTTEERMYYCVSKNPEDISEWNDWQYYYCYTAVEGSTYNATYPTVFIVHDDEGIEGNDVIYVGWRGVHWKPTLAKFSMPDENGVIETIMGQTQFANTSYYSYDDGGRNDGGRRPYTKYDYDFDRNKIYITFTSNHPDNDVKNHIYYVYLNLEDQNLYTAKDNLLQPLPFENKTEYVSQGAKGTTGQWGVLINELIDDYPELLVFDASEQTGESYGSGGSNERRGWTWDIKVNEKGEPCIVYVDVTATAPGEDGSLPTWYGPSVNDSTRSHHYYWYARWDSDTQTWVKTFLTYGGKWWHENATQERCYSGGLTFDHSAEDANVIYLSIPTMGEYGNIFEIYRWESDDHGATWTVREPITENSKINNVRPNIIYNYKENEDGTHAGPRLLWKSGEYRYWMNYEYKTGVWTDWAADGFITQDDPEMFADAALYVNGEKADILPTGEEVTVTGKFNVTNISIGDGEVLLALAHYNSEGALVSVETVNRTIPARSVPQIGMVGAPKTVDGALSPMGTEEVIVEIDYTATIKEGDTVKLLAWNRGIEHPLASIVSVPFSTSTDANSYLFVDTFTYEGTDKLILDENGENYNGWVSKVYGVDNAVIADNNYAAITKAPFGNTGLHLYGISSDGSGIMASHALPDTEGKDYTIKFSMRYIDEMSWNNTSNAGFTLSHGVPVYNDGDATPCAIQFRHGTSWAHYNGRSSTGYVRPSRWFDGNVLSWIFGNSVYSEQGRGNAYDGLMTGSNYEVTINVSPANRTINFTIYDGHRTAYHSTRYVDADSYDWDSNPIDTITFSVSGDKWGEIYIDDLTVELSE